jgi:membrane fusion protein (multidrug efflux system)
MTTISKTYNPTQMKRLILLSTVLFLAACGNKGAEDKTARLDELKKQQAAITTEIRALEAELAKEGKGNEVKSRDVVVAEVSQTKFTHYIEIQGKVEADQNVTVTAKMPGTIIKVNAEVGQEVKAGQILAELDREAIVKGIDELKQQLTFVTDVYNRQQSLWNQKIGSEIQFLTAKNNKEALEKKLITLNEQLDYAYIKSPINGMIDEVYAKVGQPAAPGVPTFRVVNFSDLKAKAEVAEINASKVRKGNTVEVIFPDAQDSTTGVVNYASKVINPMTRTFFVEVPLKSGKSEYRPNSVAILKVADYKNEKAITVPIRIVQNAEDGMYVLVAEQKDGKWIATKRVVTLGNSYNGIAEVTSGLNLGDKLVTVGYQNINVGDFLTLK